MVVNVAELMASRLAPSTLSVARAVGAAAESSGVRPYLVGGTIRDMLTGQAEDFDLDVTLVGASALTLDRIPSLTGGTVSRRSQFNTAKLRLDDLQVDLAMARVEDYPTPGSLPVVRSGTLAEDLARRDFSVNAMAVSLRADDWGDLYDPHGGLTDLDQRRLRVLHEGSFRDDPTRILRAARYSSRLGLTLTPETLDALLGSVSLLDRVSPARVRNELERVFVELDPGGALRLLCEWGTLWAIHPSINYEAATWRRFATKASDLSPGERVEVAYAAIAHELSDLDANGVIARLNPRSNARQAIRDSAALGRIPASDLTGLSNSRLATILDPLTESAVLGASLATAGDLRRRLSLYLRDHRRLRPHLGGDELISIGAPQGPVVGRVLKLLRYARLDGEVCSPDDETELAEKLIAEFAEN